MTPLQKYLRKNGHEKITEELGINVFEHPTLPLIGFKYSQIESPKTHPVVRWARGTVLDKRNYDMAAQPFVRFFNYGEHIEEMDAFDWSDFTATTKEDGSLCIVYFYAGGWRVNTSGSFAQLPYDKHKIETWAGLFWRTFKENGGLIEHLQLFDTYIFELCTMENKVIRMYPKGRVFLLGVVQGVSGELPWDLVQKRASQICIEPVEQHHFKSMADIETFLAEKEKTDASFEGVVIRDKKNIRFKLKSKAYLALHRLHDNGNVSRTDRLVQLALANEGDEVLVYLPELKDRYREIQKILAVKLADLRATWERHRAAPDQKTFAMAVKDHPYSGILFQMRKMNAFKPTDNIEKLWSQSAELVMKRWPVEDRK